MAARSGRFPGCGRGAPRASIRRRRWWSSFRREPSCARTRVRAITSRSRFDRRSRALLPFRIPMQIHHASKSDVGMKRDNNEDNLLVFPEQNVFAVFDGMGGHAAGVVASSIAVNEVKEFFTYTGKDEDATWPFKAERDKNYDENRTLTAIKLAN